MESYGVHVWHYKHPQKCDKAKLKLQGSQCWAGVPTKSIVLGQPTLEADLPDLMLLHYEACTVDQWINKFSREKNASEEKLKGLLFPYYLFSINQTKKCDANSEIHMANVPGCNRTDLANAWMRWKTRANPKFKAKYLMPINIPWTMIYKHAESSWQSIS